MLKSVYSFWLNQREISNEYETCGIAMEISRNTDQTFVFLSNSKGKGYVHSFTLHHSGLV